MALVESGESVAAKVAPHDRERLARAVEWLMTRKDEVRRRMTGELRDAYDERGILLTLLARDERHTTADAHYEQNSAGVEHFGRKLQAGALIFFILHRIGLDGVSLQEQLLETESGWTALGAVLIPLLAKGALAAYRTSEKNIADDQALTRVARTLSRRDD